MLVLSKEFWGNSRAKELKDRQSKETTDVAGVIPDELFRRRIGNAIVINEVPNYGLLQSPSQAFTMMCKVVSLFDSYEGERYTPETIIPVAIAVRNKENQPYLLFVPPRLWNSSDWTNRDFKQHIGVGWDSFIMLRRASDAELSDRNLVELYERLPKEQDWNAERFDETLETYSDWEWNKWQVEKAIPEIFDYYASGKVSDYNEKIVLKRGLGFNLKSPGHVKLCMKLEEMGYMHMWEAPTWLLGDKKTMRYIDLIVVHSGRALIVEIDGKTHYNNPYNPNRTQAQKDDDDLRDRLIGKHFPNRVRYSHDYLTNNFDDVVNEIVNRLDPSLGNI